MPHNHQFVISAGNMPHQHNANTGGANAPHKHGGNTPTNNNHTLTQYAEEKTVRTRAITILDTGTPTLRADNSMMRPAEVTPTLLVLQINKILTVIQPTLVLSMFHTLTRQRLGHQMLHMNMELRPLLKRVMSHIHTHLVVVMVEVQGP